MVHFMKRRGLRNSIAFCLAAILLMGSIEYASMPVLAYASTVQEEQEKIDNLTEEKKELETQVAEMDDTISDLQQKQDAYLVKMNEAKEQIATYQSQINDVNVELDDLNEKLDDLNKQLDEVNDQIKQKQKEIQQKQQELDDAKQTFKARLSAMYMASGDLSIMSVVLGAESFSDFLTQTQVLKNISENDSQLMDDLNAFKQELETLKVEMEDFKSSLEDTKTKVEDTKEEVESKKQEIVTLQNSEKAKADEYDDLQAESQALIDEVEQEQSLTQDEIAALEADIAAAEATMADIIAQEEEKREEGSSDGSGSSLPSSSGWVHPCPNYTYISSYFGPRPAPIAGASTNHGAMDFAAPSGTAIYATRSGTVSTASWGWGGGYGNYIILNHGDGFYSLYAHCSSLSVSSGQTVSQGQKIASVGSTGNSTGPHLHFEIRDGNTKVNPANYINP